jgi:hypothetical protein
MSRHRFGGLAYFDEVVEKGGCWFIGFPPNDLRAVTKAARTAEPV